MALSIFSINIIIFFWYFSINFSHFNYISLCYCKKFTLLGLKNLYLYLDTFSLYFIFLTSLLFFICHLLIKNIKFKFKFTNLLIFLELMLICSFLTINLIFFYIFFELTLIPMILLIILWGTRYQKIRAIYLLILYTILGSLLLIFSISYLFITYGTTNILIFSTFFIPITFSTKLIWFFCFCAFAVKIPLFPFHLWLPEAHVEAPTIGSILLAGILLKLGVYGYLRFFLPLFKKLSFIYLEYIYLIGILGLLYASGTAIRQNDFKRIIAYASIAHMSLIILGLFSFNLLGIYGSIFQSLNHGFIASGLFLILGSLYLRFKSRLVSYYSGLVLIMPYFSIFFFLLLLSNLSFPLTNSFLAEFLLLFSVFNYNIYIGILATLSTILSSIYSLWLFNKICFGNFNLITLSIKTKKILRNITDLTQIEILSLNILMFFILILGIYPFILLFLLSTKIYWQYTICLI